MDGGRNKGSGDEEIVGGVKADVPQGEQSDDDGRQLETDEPGDHQHASYESGCCKDDGGSIQIAGAGDGQKAACEEAQQRQLKEPVHLIRGR